MLILDSAPPEQGQAERMPLEREPGQQAVGEQMARETVAQLSPPVPVLPPNSERVLTPPNVWEEVAVAMEALVLEWGWIPAAVGGQKQPELAEGALVVAQELELAPVAAGRQAGWGREQVLVLAEALLPVVELEPEVPVAERGLRLEHQGCAAG